jgi:hypothetical protein
MNGPLPGRRPRQARADQADQERRADRVDGADRADLVDRADRAGGGPDVGPGQPGPSGSFDDEVRQALSYEKGLAAKALVALALVAALVIARLLGF